MKVHALTEEIGFRCGCMGHRASEKCGSGSWTMQCPALRSAPINVAPHTLSLPTPLCLLRCLEWFHHHLSNILSNSTCLRPSLSSFLAVPCPTWKWYLDSMVKFHPTSTPRSDVRSNTEKKSDTRLSVIWPGSYGERFGNPSNAPPAWSMSRRYTTKDPGITASYEGEKKEAQI